MDRAISNLTTQAGVALRDAVVMATRNPARVGRIAGRLRGLTPGERADVVRFRLEEGGLQVIETFLSGERVYTS
jgi:N-acetylglucosamine-6-phosphate deacetylase